VEEVAEGVDVLDKRYIINHGLYCSNITPTYHEAPTETYEFFTNSILYKKADTTHNIQT
jgi:hypothetical protein